MHLAWVSCSVRPRISCTNWRTQRTPKRLRTLMAVRRWRFIIKYRKPWPTLQLGIFGIILAPELTGAFTVHGIIVWLCLAHPFLPHHAQGNVVNAAGLFPCAHDWLLHGFCGSFAYHDVSHGMLQLGAFLLGSFSISEALHVPWRNAIACHDVQWDVGMLICLTYAQYPLMLHYMYIQHICSRICNNS